MKNPFRYFNSSPEAMYVRYPLSLRQVEDLLFERGIDICSSGGSMDPAVAYAAFRCRLPSPDALHETEEPDGR